ncbi:MAG: hypothetical protein ABI576_00795 [Flavobacterium sp.]
MIKKVILPIILVLIFAFTIYNSKKEYYEKSIEFNNKSFNAEVEKIVEGRGTKVYYQDYNTENYFYLEDYSGVKLFVGDVLRKNSNEISIRRKIHVVNMLKLEREKA